MKKRIMSMLLAIVMVAGMLPGFTLSASAADTNTGKAIQLGTSGISGPTASATTGNIHYTPSDYVYFGVNGSTPIKWRVLDADKANDGTTSGMFLLSEYLLASGVVFESAYNSDDGDGQTNPNEWQNSDAQTWCGDFVTSSFKTDAEKSALLGVEKTDVEQTDSANGKLYSLSWGTSNLTKNDEVFFLSVRELADYVGNYDGAPGLTATDTAHSAGEWWLRSPYAINTGRAGAVYGDGGVRTDFVYHNWAARPAFNLNLNSVLFTSAAEGGKADGFNAVGDYSGSDWKLTLLDESRNFSVTEKSLASSLGGTVSINYSGAKTGSNEYISAMIVDGSGNLLYYGRIGQSSESGTASITIPSDLAAGNYTLNVFSEQYNGDYKTDYASAFNSVSLTVDNTAPELTAGEVSRTSDTEATVKFTSDKAGTYYYAVVESGAQAPTINTTETGTACTNGENTINLTNLSGTGAKDIYIVVKDAAGNESRPLKIEIPAYAVSTMQIFVKVLTAESPTLPFNVSPTTTIAEIKEKICSSKNIPVEKQSLFYQGKILEDNKTLQDYSIQKDSTLHLMIAPAITTGSLSDGTVGTAYSQTLTADGYTPKWSIESGSLPAGLSLDADTGEISGTPTAAGTSTFTVKATNSAGSDEKELSITINAAAVQQYTVNVSASPAAGGTVSGGGTYDGNASVTVTASAHSGYKFVKWTENGTQVSTDASYTFTATADRTLVAVFEAETGVSNSGTPAEITYDGNTFDVSTMFTKDTNAGEASYEIVVLGTEGEGSATLGADGKTLTITKAGVITVKMTTAANGAYAAGSAQTTLTVKLGAGVGDITIESWTYGETAKTPAVTSETNVTVNVTYLYESTDGKGYSSDSAPTTAGAYKVTATFAATDLYAKTTDSAEFTVEKAEPSVKTAPTATRIQRGKKLEASTIKGGEMIGVDGTTLEGTFTWKAPETVMDTKGNIDAIVVFTPNDTTNYKAVEITVSVEVYTTSGSIIVTPTYYDVKFDTNGAGTIAKQTVRRNSTATEPADPVKDGYTFGGWYTDKECTKAYDFDTKVTKDITLYAKWTEDKPATSGPCDGTAADNCPSLAFSDLDTTQWYHSGVDYVLNKGMMNGMDGGIFAPNGNLSRAMLVTILWRLEGEPIQETSADFFDVASDQWYTEAIRWAASENIVEGYGDTFDPNDPITREQMVTIMFRYAKYKGYDVSVGENTNILSYDDAFDVADWAIPAMQWACGEGLIQGIADGSKMNLAPQGNATRAQAAAILQRFCENVTKED